MNKTAKKYVDLFHYPITRETFAYGGDEEEQNGYVIDPAHCLHCARCVEFCPANAIDRLHP